MKKRFLYIAALCLPIFTLVSCEDEADKNFGPVLGQGDEVVFNLLSDNMSRTMYQDDWNATTTQQLYWGNYIKSAEDQIKIFCYQGARQIATYKVNPQSENNAIAESIEKTGSYGIQWGNESDTHNFYAFYPAEYAGDAFVGNSPNIISAKVDAGQSPVNYHAVKAADNVDFSTVLYEGLDKINANTTQSSNNSVVIVGEPDMKSAIMMAATSVSSENYGKPVGLKFNVLADVLDISINGPVVPNHLNGNSGNTTQDQRAYILIQKVEIVSKSNKAICGNFTLDMSTGKASNISGNSRIQLQTAQVVGNLTYNPRLNVRSESTDASKYDDIDHLRLRAFLIPGQVTDLSDLKLVVTTDCGTYEQELKSQAVETGKIHRINMPYFSQRGTEFQLGNWIAQLDPTIYINELSLPGTWHSSVEAFQGANKNTLNTQYEAGIRAFEVHARNANSYENPVWGSYTQQGTPTTTVTDNRESATITNNPSSGGTSGTCSRTVTFTKTVTTTSMADIVSYSLPLLNYQNNNNLSTSFTNLKSLINSGEFVVVEIGMEGQGNAYIPVSNTQIKTEKSTATVTQTGTWTRLTQYSTHTYTWDDIDDPVATQYGSTTTSTEEKPETKILDAGQAWVMAVSSLAKSLADAGVVYPDKIDANTTIGDVAGKIIIKVNTNNDSNESGWPKDTPALFSRWTDGSASQPLNVGLNWGQPALTTGTNPMTWCFTELDNIGSSLDGRKAAVAKMNEESIKNYISNNHDTWYECQIGGYVDTEENLEDNCKAVATEMNQYMINTLSDPNRQPCPLGLILMNYALDETYSGPQLISTIVNNNSAFILNRAGATSTQAADKTNSSYQVVTGNPLK